MYCARVDLEYSFLLSQLLPNVSHLHPLRPRLSDIICRQVMIVHEGLDLIVKVLSPFAHSVSDKINKEPEPALYTTNLVFLPTILPATTDCSVLSFELLKVRLDELLLAYLPLRRIHV
mmetsp:Transcript_35689/g.72379  ORF Transcript_35689/g.72379 Transcript_35689/m.72379 type:complete len:118 (-) Transcript_35689:286-639(-)